MRSAFRISVVAIGSVLLTGCFLHDRDTFSNYTSSHLPYPGDPGIVSIPDTIVSNTCSGFYAVSADTTNVDVPAFWKDIKSCTTALSDPGIPYDTRLNMALAAFNSAYAKRKEEGTAARNRIQDAIMEAADRKCGDFKIALTRADTFSDTDGA